MRLALIRHGAALGEPRRCIGWTDAPISPAGLVAIGKLAAAWESDCDCGGLGSPSRLIASDLARARASAACLAAAWRLPLETDSRLREVNFGYWEGKAWEDLEREDGLRLAEWMENWVDARPPEGESFSDLRRRAAAWYEELYAVPNTEQKTIAVVAHAGLIRALLCNLLNWSPARAFETRIDPASVAGLDCQAGRAELRFIRDGRS